MARASTGADIIPAWRAARPEDAPAIVQLMRAYYDEDGYPFREAEARVALTRLVNEPQRGVVLVVDCAVRDLSPDGGKPAERTDTTALGGYAVLTIGYSLEYHGLDAFVDELYLAPAVRRGGLSREALALLEAECVSRGVRALHLEVERDNRVALDLYRRSGFRDHQRFLMTKPLG